MTERPDPAKVIPGPDPGACPSCGEWRKSGMIHNCGNNPVNDPAKVIAEALAEKLHWLADPERAQELAEAVLAALAAAGFPVGEPRDVNEIIERLREQAQREFVREDEWVRLSDAVAAAREAAQPDTDKDGGDRLYNLLALFDTRDGSYIANLVRSAREGWERSHPDMGEDDAWAEFDWTWAARSSRERLAAARPATPEDTDA